MPNPNPGKAPYAVRLVSVLLITLTVFAIAEIIMRTAVFPQWKSLNNDMLVKHPLFGHFNRPNATVNRYKPLNYNVINRSNSLGFRDREDGFEEDLKGIWLAGGSNSFGAGLEDNQIYAARLEESGYRTVNLSSEGHRPHQQGKVIRSLFAKNHRPRAIIFEFTINQGNFNILANLTANDRVGARIPGIDFATNSAKPQTKNPAEILTANFQRFYRTALPGWLALKARLIKNSATYGWLKVGITEIPYLKKMMLQWGIAKDVDTVGVLRPEMYRNEPDNQTDRLIHATADYFKEMQDWVDTNLGVPFAVMVIPSHQGIDDVRFRKWQASSGLSNEPLDPHRPRQLLIKIMRGRGIDVLDPNREFGTSTNDRLIFPDDGHLNAKGHRILSSVAERWLRAKGITPLAPK